MDLNAIRTVVTVLSFASFIGIWVWAWSGRNRQRFEALASQCIDLTDSASGDTQDKGGSA